MDHIPDEDDPAFVLSWADSITDGLVREGVIDPAGKTREELREEFRAWFDTDGEEYIRDLHVAIDYQASIHAEARRYLDRGAVQLSVVMYATYFEHWLNGLLSWGASRLGLDDDDVVKMLRANSLDGKTTYLWRLVFGERLDDRILGTVKRVADARNAFVHYKWRSYHADSPVFDDQRALLVELLSGCEPVIDLAEKYERDLYTRLAQSEDGDTDVS
ncbi:hypothetical protein [Kribbella sp. CA-294648]|uniref:hypothetical protein n=1 Tax=Kribbella sp. CA-294648 TaxID=3239948 RepID=UPI003D8EB5C1